MISCIITAYKEPRTIGKAIVKMMMACEKAEVLYEILVFAPDTETIQEAMNYTGKNIKVIVDPGKGKPAALNLAFQHAQGCLLVLSDGDVYVNQYAIRELLNKINDPNIGAVSGHPRSLESKDNMFGYWSHLLTDMADMTRKEAKGNFVCSGYLYALRPGIVKELPEDCLSDDAYISYKVIESGYKIDYAPGAQVFVKYPDNFKEWMAQKKRSTGGFTQLTSQYKMQPKKEMRSMWQEVKGFWDVIKYASTPRELGWTIYLVAARVWMWLNIFYERKIIKKEFNKTWTRITSTK